uniref:Subtilase family protein n=1 Tax=Candidatus Kentrum sp. TUN TaxID=2126343 RepID=A0A450ZJH0_9GAMM|nr:MAG: Subtilase family protein [Candidatus Kentron sp. TUN]VFK55894.1 MAG: Subtilase family protein [Candidatus Kentron sp. TUN]
MIEPRPHLVLAGYARTEKFRSPRSGGNSNLRRKIDRARHGRALMNQLTGLKRYAESIREEQEASGYDIDFGIRLQFTSPPGIELAFESLAHERQGIELLNVKHEENITRATVFIPDGKLDVFEKLIREYIEQDTKPTEKHPNGRPKHQDLAETIQEIRESALDGLWTDDPEAMPRTEDEPIWWEVWLPLRGDREVTTRRFQELAETIGFRVAPGVLRFPERTILLMRGSKGQIKRSLLFLNSIAELRRAKETADFFDSLSPTEQREWVEDLLSRTSFSTGRDLPHVCILDTGVNRGHPLLARSIEPGDLHSIEPDWEVSDNDGHGTGLAGLALFGDLTRALETQAPIRITHRLESVKLLRHGGDNAERHHGHLTVEAVSRPEIQAPHRVRVFSMAVTAKDNRDRGRPSAWSVAIDNLAADTQGDGLTPRLIIVSAGNTENASWLDYPDSNTTDGIHDPGQAWNALTVGPIPKRRASRNRMGVDTNPSRHPVHSVRLAPRRWCGRRLGH